MRLITLAGCALLFLFDGSVASAADLETILARNSEAHGGNAYKRIASIQVELLISEPSYEVHGTYLASRDGLMRIDIRARGTRIFAEGISTECAWAWNLNQPEAERGACVDEAKATTLRHGLELPGLFYTLKEVRDRGAEVRLMGSVGTEAGPEWQLRVTLEDGFTQDYFIDQVSYLITRTRDFRTFQPEVDPTEVLIETRFENPRWVEGVLRFGRQVNVNVNTGELLGTTSVVDLKFNPEVSPELFDAQAPGRR